MTGQAGRRGLSAEAERRCLPARLREPAPIVPVLRLRGVIGAVSPLRTGLSLEKTAGAIERRSRVKRAKAWPW